MGILDFSQERNDKNVDIIDNSVKSVLDNTKLENALGKINSAVQSTTSTINNLNSKVTEAFVDKANDIKKNLQDNGLTFNMPEFDEVNFTDDLKVKCPYFIKMAGECKVDFGKVFLTADQSKLIGNVQAAANTAINVVNNVDKFLSPEALAATQELAVFLVTDLINKVTEFATNILSTYLSPSFYIGLTEQLVNKTATYLTLYIKTPAQILKEVETDMVQQLKDQQEENKKNEQEKLKKELSETFVNVMEKIKSAMNEARPILDKINKYFVYGPDYVIREVINIYTKYLNIGYSIVNSHLSTINQKINTFIEKQAQAAAMISAAEINKKTEVSLRKAIVVKNKAQMQIKIKVMSQINMIKLNLLALIGG